jgi:hypothetical protein
MDKIYQVVVQQKSSATVRAIVQYDADGTNQKVISYDSLTDEEKKQWDSFLTMLSSK